MTSASFSDEWVTQVMVRFRGWRMGSGGQDRRWGVGVGWGSVYCGCGVGEVFVGVDCGRSYGHCWGRARSAYLQPGGYLCLCGRCPLPATRSLRSTYTTAQRTLSRKSHWDVAGGCILLLMVTALGHTPKHARLVSLGLAPWLNRRGGAHSNRRTGAAVDRP